MYESFYKKYIFEDDNENSSLNNFEAYEIYDLFTKKINIFEIEPCSSHINTIELKEKNDDLIYLVSISAINKPNRLNDVIDIIELARINFEPKKIKLFHDKICKNGRLLLKMRKMQKKIRYDRIFS